MKISANKHAFKVLRMITRKIEETKNKLNSQLSSHSRHFEAAKRSLSIQHIVAVNPEKQKKKTKNLKSLLHKAISPGTCNAK